MAISSWGTNDPLAVKLWSKKLAVEALKATQVQKFISESDDSLVQIKTEANKAAGDKITYGLRMQLYGAGVQGDGTLEGNEEALATYTDALILDQLRHAVRVGGRMTQQRIPFDVRDEALSGLRDWWADRIDYSFFNQICGNILVTDTRYTGNQACTASDALHYINTQPGGPNGDDRDANAPGTIAPNGLAQYAFTLSLLDRAKEKAKIITPAIRPVKLAGQDWFVAFIHPSQVTDLRLNTNPGQWIDIQKAAITGGEITKNPIFTGALGVYNGIVLHQDYRVPTGFSTAAGNAPQTNVRRAVLCGAQSAMLGFGQRNSPNKYTWVEELFDYENELGVAAGTIFGLKKTVFNGTDFATIVMSSYSPPHN